MAIVRSEVISRQKAATSRLACAQFLACWCNGNSHSNIIHEKSSPTENRVVGEGHISRKEKTTRKVDSIPCHQPLRADKDSAASRDGNSRTDEHTPNWEGP